VNGHQRPINRWLGHEFYRESFDWLKMFYPLKRLREFCLAKMSYPFKRQWEKFQKNFIVKCSLKKKSLAKHLPNLKGFLHDLHCNILLLKKEFFFHSSYSMRVAKRLWVSCCKASEHKGWVVPVWFWLCKGFYKDSGNLKWVAWVLDVGTGSGRTSIKLCLHFLFPYLIYFVAINCVLHV